MRLIGYKSLNESGFSLPLFSYSRSNALFIAIPDIEGDHTARVSEFEIIECDIDGYIDSEPEVEIGNLWHDVFLFQGAAFVGTPSDIHRASAPLHDLISREVPLSYLDLVLTAGRGSVVSDALRVRSFLEMRLGIDGGSEAFQEAVVRPGIALEIRRNRHRQLHSGDLPPALRNFELTQRDRDSFVADFTSDASGEVNASDLAEQIKVFSRRIGVEIEVSGLIDERGIETDEGGEQALPAGPALGGRTSTRLFGLVREIALDLGTTNTRIFEKSRGLVISEPSVVAIELSNGKRQIIAIGDRALVMQNKTASNIEVVKPVRDGAITDIDVAVLMIRHFVDRVRGGGRFRRPIDVVICTPAGATSTERRAIQNAAKQAGASRVSMIEAPLAAAIGAGIAVSRPVGSMIVNIGGGVTEVAIISLGRLAYSTSVRAGGDSMDYAIVSYMRRQHNILIGIGTAERLKKDFGLAYPPADGKGLTIHIRGVDLVNRVPKEVSVTQFDIYEAILEPLGTIMQGVRIALEMTAPELAADIIDNGIVLTGGGALIYGLDEFLQSEIGMRVSVAEDPLSCVARGLGKIMNDPGLRGLLQLV